jgi:hypothetical protein
MEIQIETKTESLPCDLTDGELLSRGQQVAELAAKKAEIEDLLADQKQTAKVDLGIIETLAASVLREIRTRKQYRDVPCMMRENFDDPTLPMIETVRLDTGEIVRTRPMTYDERQGKLVGIATPLRQEA